MVQDKKSLQEIEQFVAELISLTDELGLSLNGVLELMDQYPEDEVMSILRTLSGQRNKTLKEGFVPPKETTEKPVRFWR